jgi:hypothetical protein
MYEQEKLVYELGASKALEAGIQPYTSQFYCLIEARIPANSVALQLIEALRHSRSFTPIEALRQ